MTLRTYWLGLLVSVALAFVLEALWLGPAWRQWRPRPGKQIVPIKADWFHARNLERDGDKWGMARVGYTDIDYEYIAPNEFMAGRDDVGRHRTVINRLGGRGNLPEMNPTGPERVVIIGDSFAFGRGLDEHETLARSLEEAWQLRHRTKLDVINLAVGGYSFWASMEVLSAKAVYFNPDRILYVTYNLDNHEPGLRHARELCERLGIQFEMAYQPSWQQGAEKVKKTVEKIKRVAAEAKVVCHDLSQAMGGVPIELLTASDGHPSRRANQLAAELLSMEWKPQLRPIQRQRRSTLLLTSLAKQQDRLEQLLSKLRDPDEKLWIRQRIGFYKELTHLRQAEVTE